MTAIDLLILLTGHFVADFVLQTDRQAQNKSRDWWALAGHVSNYTMAMIMVFAAWVTVSGQPYHPFTLFWFAVVTFVAHFLTDAVTSRITSRLWFIELYGRPTPLKIFTAYPFFARLNGNRHGFFVVIGLDQLIHAWTLALTWLWVMR